MDEGRWRCLMKTYLASTLLAKLTTTEQTLGYGGWVSYGPD